MGLLAVHIKRGVLYNPNRHSFGTVAYCENAALSYIKYTGCSADSKHAREQSKIYAFAL